MRIGLLCHSSCGGSARVATELAARLARRGHRVHLFARGTPFGWRAGSNGVVVHPLLPEGGNCLHPAQLHAEWPADEFRTFVSRLVQACVEERIEVLHFHYALPFAFMAAEVRHRLGGSAPVLVGTLHGTDVTAGRRDPPRGPRLAAALQRLDALTTVSRSHAALAVEMLGLPGWPEVVPNFVDLDRFHPGTGRSGKLDVPSSETGGRRRRPRIVHVSNFRPVKDPLSVGRIFLLVRERMDAELWLVGEGEGMDPLKALLQQSGAEDDVRYWGLQPDVAPFLAGADLLLMTSLAESFCLVALESMACGTPVLAGRVGGLPEVVVHGETGYLFPIGSHARAADLAVELLSDPIRHRAMREAGVARARGFEETRVTALYEELYLRLLAPGMRSRAPASPESYRTLQPAYEV